MTWVTALFGRLASVAFWIAVFAVPAFIIWVILSDRSSKYSDVKVSDTVDRTKIDYSKCPDAKRRGQFIVERLLGRTGNSWKAMVRDPNRFGSVKTVMSFNDLEFKRIRPSDMFMPYPPLLEYSPMGADENTELARENEDLREKLQTAKTRINRLESDLRKYTSDIFDSAKKLQAGQQQQQGQYPPGR